MQKAALIIWLILSFPQAYSQDGSSLLSKDTIVNTTKKCNNNKAIKTVIYATGYVGATLICYRYFDTDIKNSRKQIKTEQ